MPITKSTIFGSLTAHWHKWYEELRTTPAISDEEVEARTDALDKLERRIADHQAATMPELLAKFLLLEARFEQDAGYWTPTEPDRRLLRSMITDARRLLEPVAA